MTKTEMLAWIKRSREGLREAEAEIRRTGAPDKATVTEWLMDASGSIGELLSDLEGAYDPT
jgi:hypothetical protein